MTSFAREQLAKIKPLCDHVGHVECQALVGYYAVYRIMFSLTVFFTLMGILMIGVKNSKDKRAGIQNGFWAVKALILAGITVGAFFIPQGTFEDVWMYFGLTGGFTFIIIQLVLLIDFAYSWNESWLSKKEDETSDCGKWFKIMLTVTFGIFVVCITGAVVMFVFYGKPGCRLNQFFISFNLILCVILSVTSILPKVQEENPSSGLLQASVVSAYMLFLTWSAVTSSLKEGCNPSLGDIITGSSSNHTSGSGTGLDAASIVSIIVWVLLVMYSSISTAGKVGTGAAEDGGFLRMNDHNESAVDTDAEGQKGQVVHDDEEDGVAYNYSLFHLVLACAALYIMMCLTNWLDPSGDLQAFQRSNAAMWVKTISAWCCAALYGWTLVAPIILTDRDFGS